MPKESNVNASVIISLAAKLVAIVALYVAAHTHNVTIQHIAEQVEPIAETIEHTFEEAE